MPMASLCNGVSRLRRFHVRRKLYATATTALTLTCVAFGGVNAFAPSNVVNPWTSHHHQLHPIGKLPNHYHRYQQRQHAGRGYRPVSSKSRASTRSRGKLTLDAHPAVIARFLASWRSYSLIPIIAGFVGWFTNYLAVQMIFYPIKWRGIPIFPPRDGQPLGVVGWQGIVPAKTVKMSEAMVNATIQELLSMEEVVQRLDPSMVADILSVQAPSIIKIVLDELTVAMPLRIQNLVSSFVMTRNTTWLRHFCRPFLMNLTINIQENIQQLLNLRNCVVNQMLSDRSLLGKLFQISGKKELSFLVDSGLWFGFFLGLIQLFVALFWDNPWTLSVGGLIVGLATNWLALKWIFEPVKPTRVGPFVLQGLFLRRQKEVSADFSEFFANQILTSQELWNSMLTDPTTSPLFAAYFADDLARVTLAETKGLVDLYKQPEALLVASETATRKLPQYLSGLHNYVDETLGIETTLRERMVAMSSEQFERVLHPIFEEDELTLILAGGGLGFLAGLAQQSLASGGALTLALTQPTLAPIRVLIASRLARFILSVSVVGGGYLLYFFGFGIGSFKRRLLHRLQDPQTAFDVLANGNGYVEPDDFVKASKDLGLPLSTRELERVFTNVDADNDGRIARQEFEDWWNRSRREEFRKKLEESLDYGAQRWRSLGDLSLSRPLATTRDA